MASEIGDLLDCPVCYNGMRPPIWQCVEGHTFCDQCKEKLADCHTCRMSLRVVCRNRALEEVVRRTMIACKHSEEGCEVKLPLNKLTEHEEKCTFRPITCPHYHGWRHKVCKWSGPVSKVVEHLTKTHAVSVTQLPNSVSTSTVQRVNNTLGHAGADWGPFLYLYKNRYFLLEFFHNAKDKDYRATLRSLSQGDSDGLAYYQIQVARHSRRLIWEGVVRSVRDSQKDIIDSNDCFTLKENLAIFFSDNESMGTEGLDKLECDIKLKISMAPLGDP
eukprot:comp15342_c0_seq1/m.12202 comp15342_c0_seq1/g.12202  ORF comp15342_c0_seq1/g.12202 comp15342_c0_seq1/m.12202 type:complete len:275 (-) comp15342_c0_seq1:699-1523(-)